MRPPAAPKRPHTFSHHGQDRVDDYAWLKDENWQEAMRDPSKLNADIRAYLEAENAHTETWSDGNKNLRAELMAGMRGRIKEDDSTVPAPDGDYDYFTRYETGGQYSVFARLDESGAESILLHGDKEADGQSFFRVGTCTHSPDHTRLAYAVDLNGSERFEVKVRDLESGTDLSDTITDAKGDVVWANDGETLFYTILDDNHRPYRIMRHKVGNTV